MFLPRTANSLASIAKISIGGCCTAEMTSEVWRSSATGAASGQPVLAEYRLDAGDVGRVVQLPEGAAARLDLDDHPDQPEWLSHVNAGVLKIKLSTAIIGISSIHLLKTFINAANLPEKAIMWQVIIHVVFLFSALAMAWVDKIMNQTVLLSKH